MKRPVMMTPLRPLALLAALWAPAALGDSTSWRMLPVTSYQARVETYEPVWNKEHEVWVSGVPGASGSFEAQYAATLDSVTTSSVEGALMYLQRDCIDIGATPWAAKGGCVRKNDVKVITFLEVTIANPNAALAEYQSDRFTYPEFCPFVEMKNGACIFTNDSATPAVVIDHPVECKQYNGIDGQPHIGPCVGAEAFPTDNIAPYFDTVWFSYPSSCVMKTWKEGKSPACRSQYPGGLCPFGTTPDGVTCQFSYKILGFLRIDDLVGINAKVAQFANGSVVGDADDDAAADAVPTNSSQDIFGNPGIDSASGSDRADDDDDDDDDADDGGASGSGNQGANAGDTETEAELTSLSMDKNFKPWQCPDGRRCYQNFAEFCEANNTEFHSTDKDRTLGLSAVKSIEFWGFPSDHRVNKNRTAFMIQMYNTRVAELSQNASAVGKMTPLPLDLSAITKKNPACYLNSLACYNAHYGCERHSYAQVCSVCREMGAKCVIKQPSYEFPQLARAPFTVPESALRSRVVKAPNMKADNSAAARPLVAQTVAAVVTAAVVALISM